MQFKISSKYEPAGDQPKAIESLVAGIKDNKKDQVLLGVTGSGKTFTMANVIQETQKPALIMAHNKTLAAQLYSEMREFFPNNAVEYFVSYYDYYQPEAYIARTDTYIEKDSSINEQIDLMRHSATRSLLERRDVIVVSSVSCIYGLGAPELYSKMVVKIKKGERRNRQELTKQLVSLQYTRNDINFERGSFRIRGDILDIFPSHCSDVAWRLSFFGDDIESIHEIDALTGEKLKKLEDATIYANSHFVTPKPTIERALVSIKKELVLRLEQLRKAGKLLEAQRLEQRTQYDIEMLVETGMCKGIENYSRQIDGRNVGEPPATLFAYVPDDALLFVDESHVTVPQIGGMYNGDRARKSSLVEYGFRLPSALDNRPLQFEEWNNMRPQTIYVSATPGPFELQRTDKKFIEQVIRPTGLIDPICEVRKTEGQIDNLIAECKVRAKKSERVLVTTLTKKMAEDLSEYLKEADLKVTYLHSDVNTLERIEIIQSLRRGEIEVLVGINLLREGLDIPECSLVAILDADKEGFLRSETALIQTIGRAARNVNGMVILYADVMTRSLKAALDETDRRRNIQLQHNKEHGITPRSVQKALAEKIAKEETAEDLKANKKLSGKELLRYIEKIRKDMFTAAADLNFEKAAKIRDELHALEASELGLKKKD